MPPDTSLWRMNVRGGWASHVKGHRCISEPWNRHNNDSMATLRELARRSWRLYLGRHKLPEHHCPISDLMRVWPFA